MDNIKTIAGILRAENAKAALITSIHDIRWACGFTGSNALLVVRPDDAFLITDGRYTTQSQEEVKNAKILIADGALAECAHKHSLVPETGQVILQAEHTSLSQHAKLVKDFGDRDWLPKVMLLSKHVAVKNADEIARIAAAQQITDDVFSGLVDFIKPGLTEQEVAAEIIYQHLIRGASAMSFDPIVASGPNGALPHARPTSRVLQQDELIVLDFGCFLNGYASDMTRTIALGKPQEEALEVYETVLEAQKAAVAAASAGMTTSALDQVARSIITEAGYGDYFTHSLGHGVGLQIHEWPRVSWQSEDELLENMVVTIEPGVYIPQQFGVRIEDLIVLKQEGCEVLTRTPKELLIL